MMSSLDTLHVVTKGIIPKVSGTTAKPSQNKTIIISTYVLGGILNASNSHFMLKIHPLSHSGKNTGKRESENIRFLLFISVENNSWLLRQV